MGSKKMFFGSKDGSQPSQNLRGEADHVSDKQGSYSCNAASAACSRPINILGGLLQAGAAFDIAALFNLRLSVSCRLIFCDRENRPRCRGRRSPTAQRNPWHYCSRCPAPCRPAAQYRPALRRLQPTLRQGRKAPA